jgi:SAM-dependent methyltransferase
MKTVEHGIQIESVQPWLAHVDVNKLPGHWLLASLGKRVLRPGGLELTRRLLDELAPAGEDEVVEFAPGLGATARLTLAGRPRSYTGIERDEAAARRLEADLGSARVRFIHGSAESTPLASGSATVVYGEAMLSMQTPEQKRRIVAEAFRLMKPGGRYGIHELALQPDGIGPAARREIEREMSMNIHAGVRPATLDEWRRLLAEAGFLVRWDATAPMHLLEPARMLSDEGLYGVLRIAFNLLRKPSARRRVLSMRRMFRRYASHLCAVAIAGVKPAA